MLLILFFLEYVNGCSTTKPEEVFQVRKLMDRSSSTSPIRLKFYYINFDLGSETANDLFEKTVTAEAATFYSEFLSVYTLEDPLVLTDVEDCGGVQVPSVHREWGVWADVLIYVTTDDTENADYISYANPCAHQVDGRKNVLAGRIMINNERFNALNKDQQIWQIKHQVGHILAFDSTLYPLYHKSDGAQFLFSEVVISTTVRGISKFLVKSPEVLKKARTNFGCDSLHGVELENDDGSALPGNHWDMRVMFNDYMSADAGDLPYISSITGAPVSYTHLTLPTNREV